MEIALRSEIPTYAGGLGVLAGTGDVGGYHAGSYREERRVFQQPSYDAALRHRSILALAGH